MEEYESNHIAVMEKLLQQAFNLHKETVRGMSSNLVKTKSVYYKTLDKCQQLQKQNEDLIQRNKELQASLDQQPNIYRCPQCSNVSPDRSEHPKSPSSKYQSESIQRISPLLSSEDECLDFGEGLDKNIEGRRKLHRKRNKRSRYSEDISPDLKRARQTSPRNSAADSVVTDSKHSMSDSHSQTFLPEDKERQDTQLCVKSRKKVLVLDTCMPEADIVDKTDKRSAKNDAGRNSELDLGVIDNLSVLVVPETMAMDDIGMEFYDVIDEKRKKFGGDLSDIQESMNEKSLNEDSDSMDDKNSTSHLDESVVLDEHQTGDVKNDTHVSIKHQIPHSLQSLLDSPEHGVGGKSSGDDVSDDVSDDMLSVSTAEKLLCEDSDEDKDKIPCSHTFSKPKIRLHRMERTDTSSNKSNHNIRNSCKNMEEVNALFATPLSKCSEKVKQNTGESSKRSLVGKPSNKSSASKTERHHQILLEKQTDIILRRSPRKHKTSVINSPAKTSSPAKSSRKCLSKLNIVATKSRSPVLQPTCAEIDNERTRSIAKSSSKRKSKMDNTVTEDLDETIAPESCNTDLTMKENQSMDCYTVMPLKDGLVDANNQFQVKVAKDKHSKKKVLDFKNNTSRTSKLPNELDETLKSPSILNDKGKLHSQVHAKVKKQEHSMGNTGSSPVIVNSSSTDSSVESPSLGSREKLKDAGDSDVEIIDSDWMSKKGRKSLSCSQDSGSRSQSRSKSKSKGKIRKSGNLYSFNMESADTETKVNLQNMHQTTLTQGFFSPKQKTMSKGSMERRKSVSPDDKISAGSFKKPIFQPGKHGKHSKTRRKACDENDLSAADGVLNETTGVENSENIYRGLNGSVDPGVELSEWCPESLPSLDADIENIDPEPHDVTIAPHDVTMESLDVTVEPHEVTMENSFDCRPRKQEKNIAHVAVVRKQDERQKLQGHGCKQCVQYYKSAGRSDKEIKEHMCQCSRHRAQYVPPDTPPHFWSIGFIDTQECHNDSGTKKKDEDVDLPSYRRRKRLNKYFKAKNELSYQEEDSEDLI